MKTDITARAAGDADVDFIEGLTAIYARDKTLLPRPRRDILEHLGNFVIAERDGHRIGCGAIRDFGGELYEVRSLAVEPAFKGLGIGTMIVEFMLERLRKRRIPCRVFALTTSCGFFLKLGFHKVDKELFPQKIWSDCLKCPKLDCCDEDAVLFEIN